MAHNTEASAGRASIAALLEVPEHNTLTDAQVRGADCAWCGKPLTAETAVDLPERRIRVLDTHFDTFPRGCRECTRRKAHEAIFEHCERCEDCTRDAGSCLIGIGLRRLMRGASL
jgi:hypothetical protein